MSINIRPIIILGFISIFGLGCTNAQKPLPEPTNQPPVQAISPTESDQPLVQAEDAEEVSSDPSLLAEGPILWEPNDDNYIITVTSTAVIQWMTDRINYIATMDNFCIDAAYQRPETFRSKILSRFNEQDRYYLYTIKLKNGPRGDGWSIDIIPNRHGYTTKEEINKAFAWVGGCEAGMVGLYTFNEHWIAYGDGCHESGGPNVDYACHAAINALFDKIVLK